MTTVLNGLLGGAVVGLVAALAAHLGGALTMSSAANEPGPSRWTAVLVQVVYGSVAGGVLIALELLVLDALGVPPTLGEALAVTVAWSAVLFVGALGVWRFALGRAVGRPQLATFGIYHAVFGVALGVWIRLTWMT